MKKQLEDELYLALLPCIEEGKSQDAKLLITMCLGHYEITRPVTDLTIYEGDVNELIIKRWIAAKLAQGCSARTIQYYRLTVQAMLARIRKPYMDVTADDIRLFLALRIHQDKVSKVTANSERRALSAFYSWLQKEEILLKNPMNKVDRIKETKMKKSAFSTMEVEKIRYACRSSRETAIVEVLLSTWCRVSELVEMKKSDIRGESITVHGKGDKYRTCYLNAKAMLSLQKYLDERSDNNPFLFPRAKYAGNVAKMTKSKKRATSCMWYREPGNVDESRPMDKSSLESIVRSIGRRAGVENCHPHRFRRTGATMALRNGMSLIQVSRMLGHEQIDTTQIYLDISDDELESAHKKYVL